MADYLRILQNPWDTLWWLGPKYHSEHGDVWPGQEDPAPGFKNPSPKDAMLIVFAMAIFLTFVKSFFEKCIGSPIALMMGIKQCNKVQGSKLDKLPELEALLKKTGYKSPSKEVLKQLCDKSEISMRDVQVWIRRRQQMVLSTRHTKFVESFWRFVFYSTMFTYGLSILWNENYLWDTKFCWIGYPAKIWSMKDTIYWYYMIELGYYMACLILQFYEVKRKDFTQMFIHHVATVILIGMSFITSRTRIGALVMLVHDFSDISLEACKMAKYAKWGETANVLFGVFGISFFVSRIVVYPYSVVYSSLIESRVHAGDPGPMLSILNTLLCVLYVLHCFWFSLIVRLVIKFSKKEDVEGDLRSEDEAPTSSEGEENKRRTVKENKEE